MSSVNNPPGPPPSEWDHGPVYVKKLHRGQRSSDSVRRLQYRLLHHNDIPAKDVKVDGNYTPGTQAAVKYFQNNMFDHADRDFRDGKQMTNRQTNRLFGKNYHVIER